MTAVATEDGLAVIVNGDVVYRPHPRQRELHRATEPYVLFGGAAGGAKSHGLRWHGIMACLEIPQFRALLLRRQFTELENTHILAVQQEVVARHLATYDAQRHRLKFSTGSILQFGHCNTDADFTSYLSTEWDWIGADEAGEFTPYQLTMLPSRLRGTRPMRRQMMLASNPGGPSHQFLKDRYIDQCGPRDNPEALKGYRPEEYRFIPSKATDNPSITEDYIERLNALPEPQRSMYRDGLWTIPLGNLFQELDAATHYVAVRDDVESPIYRRCVTADWGRSNIAPAIWWCLDDAIEGATMAHAYQEWAPSDVPPVRWAEGVVQRSLDDEEQATIDSVILDAAAFDNQQNFGPSPAEQMIPVFRKHRIRLIPSVKGPGSVRTGCELLHTWFDTYGGTMEPLMTVSRACPRLWGALVSIQRGDPSKGQSAREPAPHQHPFVDLVDCPRYLVQGRPRPSAVHASRRPLVDPEQARLGDDQASQQELYRRRAEAARAAGKPVPPRMVVKPEKVRKPWDRR